MSREFATSFYNSSAWKKARQVCLSKNHGICSRCGKAFASKDLIVHHKIMLSPDNINDPNITLNQDNLELLCVSCHSIEHGNKDDLNKSFIFDDEGNIIDVR